MFWFELTAAFKETLPQAVMCNARQTFTGQNATAGRPTSMRPGSPLAYKKLARRRRIAIGETVTLLVSAATIATTGKMFGHPNYLSKNEASRSGCIPAK
jgi:hypothetical protein